MTILRISVTDNEMTSLVEGFGKDELQKCVDKLQDDPPWYLVIKSKANYVQTTTNPGRNWQSVQKSIYMTAFGACVLTFLAGFGICWFVFLYAN